MSGKILDNDRKFSEIEGDDKDEDEFEDYSSIGKQWENPTNDINENNLRQDIIGKFDVTANKNIGEGINIPTNMSWDKIDIFSSTVKEG